MTRWCPFPPPPPPPLSPLPPKHPHRICVAQMGCGIGRCYHWGAEQWERRSGRPPPRPRAAPGGFSQLEPGHRVGGGVQWGGGKSQKTTNLVWCTQAPHPPPRPPQVASVKQTKRTRTIVFLPPCADLERRTDKHTHTSPSCCVRRWRRC